MKNFEFISSLIFLFTLAPFSFATETKSTQEPIPPWAVNLFQSCTEQHSENACQKGIEQLLKDNQLWGDANQNLAIGEKVWKEKPLKIRIVNNKDKEGAFGITLENEVASPEISLSMAYSLPEMLITLNHELTHYANSQELLNLIPSRKIQVSSCISAYELAVLQDENRAFRSEVTFWSQSPDWFKRLFVGVPFHSKFSGKKYKSFEEYYEKLSASLKKDIQYASKQYIKIGQYPKCALKKLY